MTPVLKAAVPWWATALLLATVSAHVLLAPYTKVEESFNLQAMHDLLYHRENMELYDHHMFPGVVPRTFLGAAATAAVASPAVAAAELLRNPAEEGGVAVGGDSTKSVSQVIVRLALGVLLWLAHHRFGTAVARTLGPPSAAACMVFSAVQFHLPFYMSRPLPNVFALGLVLVGLAHWLEGSLKTMIRWFVPAILIFRAELLVLLGPLMLGELLRQRITFYHMLLWGITAGLASIAVTVAVDSVLWGRPIWPEAEVLYYNTVLNKSKDWGVSPFGWYFYSAIPRAMSATLALVPVGAVVDSRVRWIVLPPPLLFVLLYSILPHKELRFIIYVFPLLNVAAAVGFVRLWRWASTAPGSRGGDAASAKKDDGDLDRDAASSSAAAAPPSSPLLQIGVKLGLVGIVVATVASTAAFASFSTINYPGGAAFARFHAEACGGGDGGGIGGGSGGGCRSGGAGPPTAVHIAVPPAQTGVSRFGESASSSSSGRGRFVYSKVEAWTSSVTPLSFEWLLTGEDGPELYAATHEVGFVTEGFDGVGFSKQWPFVTIRTAPKVYALRRKHV